jgi:hypothetical protein
LNNELFSTKLDYVENILTDAKSMTSARNFNHMMKIKLGDNMLQAALQKRNRAKAESREKAAQALALFD